jgi:hypothetical protein
MKDFRLFGTSACHLCELAHEMLLQQQEALGGFTFEEVDISASDALFERYGLRIPVLQHPDHNELGWPFTEQQLQDFLQS